MTRTRVSTTVDEVVLAEARRFRPSATDAALVDEALLALVQRHRRLAADAAYVGYDRHPIYEPDAWGDLASFRPGAAAS